MKRLKHKNPHMRKVKNTHPLLVSCNFCKTSLLVYQKGGKGNLIKLQIPRVIDSNFPLYPLENALVCYQCEEQMGSLTEYRGNPTYYLARGAVNTKRLTHYKF